MRIVNSFVLELREYKGISIVTRIKFDNSATSENLNELKGYHGLTKEHWQNLDTELAKLFYNFSDEALKDCQFREKVLKLDEYRVEITISSISMKALLACLGHATFENKTKTIALDLFIRRREKVKKASRRLKMLVSPTCSAAAELEYCPQPVSNVSPCIESNCLLYVPSKIENKASNSNPVNIDLDDEERYSPELKKEYHLPVYKPMPIKKDSNQLPYTSKKKQKMNIVMNKLDTAGNNLLIDNQIATHHILVTEENNFFMLKENLNASQHQNCQGDNNQLRYIQSQKDVLKSQRIESDKRDNESQEDLSKRKKYTSLKKREDSNQVLKTDCIEKGRAVSKTMKEIFGSEPESDES
ncbi:unnamed protein product [Ceratitis capitata]|nr:unnamed protein product [Ceratitis capitata]